MKRILTLVFVCLLFITTNVAAENDTVCEYESDDEQSCVVVYKLDKQDGRD